MPELGFADHCFEARAAVSRGDFTAAKKHFERALRIKPNSVDAVYGLATVCYLMKDYAAATKLFQDVQQLDPLHAGAAINLGALANLQGEYEQAITYLRRGIQLDRSRSEGYYNLGIAYRKLGRYELAIQAYREAHHLNPRMVEAVYNLANVYFEMARYDQALTYYKRALEINPGFRKAHDGMKRADQKMRESRRPLDSGVIVTGATAAGDPMETDARLDRLLNPEHDQDVLARFFRQTEIAQAACDEWHRATEKFDAAIRAVAIHISTDSPPDDVLASVKQLRGVFEDFRGKFGKFTEAYKALQNLRDQMVEHA